MGGAWVSYYYLSDEEYKQQVEARKAKKTAREDGVSHAQRWAWAVCAALLFVSAAGTRVSAQVQYATGPERRSHI